MTLQIPNPRKRGDDIQVRSALGLHYVKPVSARGREWFKKNTGSIEPQFLFGGVLVALADSFAALGLQVVFNPPGDTREIRRIVSERLEPWREKILK